MKHRYDIIYNYCDDNYGNENDSDDSSGDDDNQANFSFIFTFIYREQVDLPRR